MTSVTKMNGQRVKLHLFCCANSVDLKELRQRLDGSGDEIKVTPLPCSGKIDILYLTKAFESGADGVAVVTCNFGECRYLQGNLRATKRVQFIEALNEETGLGKGRTAIVQIGSGDMQKVVNEIEDLRLRIKAIPRTSFTEDESELDKE